jgi:hypothetical protein
MYDYFVGAMTCSNCGAVSTADSSTNLQTYIRHNARGIEIPVGFQLDACDATDQSIASSAYLPVGRGRTDGQTRLLDTWTCPTCKRENWARVTLVGTEVAAIEGVTLDRATLESAQFITDSCFIAAAQVSGIPAQEITDPVNVLLERLP